MFQTRTSRSSTATLFAAALLDVVANRLDVATEARKPVVQPEDPSKAQIKALRREIEDARDLLERTNALSGKYDVNYRLDRAEASLDEIGHIGYTSAWAISRCIERAVDELRDAQRSQRRLTNGF